MGFNFLTLDDIETHDKTVFLRVDINCPLDPTTDRILDDTRIKEAVPTIEALEDSKLVVGSHQSRPGMEDFTSLEEHARILQKHVSLPVRFVDDIFGPTARQEIKRLRSGEILLLENLRFYAEENIEAPVHELVKTHLVRKLAPYLQVFVNDAFSAAHRSQPSLVGFAEILPTAAGRLMERELRAMEKVVGNPEGRTVYLLGGVKVKERLKIVEKAFQEERAETLLTAGLLAEVFMAAKGHTLGEAGKEKLAKLDKELGKAKELLGKYGDKIRLPVDVAVDVRGHRKEHSIGDLPEDAAIMDIGEKTIEAYSETVKRGKVVVANGPMGVFEKEEFAKGTHKLLEALANSQGFTIIGGGHLGALANIHHLSEKMGHISTGGGAMLSLLSGEKMPVLEALVKAAQRR